MRLIEIEPATGSVYPGLSGTDLLGCGPTPIEGRLEVIGVVGGGGPVYGLGPFDMPLLDPPEHARTLDAWMARDAVPGLTLVVPFGSAAFAGRASYRFGHGSDPYRLTYAVCVGPSEG